MKSVWQGLNAIPEIREPQRVTTSRCGVPQLLSRIACPQMLALRLPRQDKMEKAAPSMK
jgi:hypothetical protein